MVKLKYGLIGHPVKHSFSPVMQNAAFKESGIDARYDLYDVAPDKLDIFLDSAFKDGFSGFNVTIPYKIKVKEYVEKNGILDRMATILGAVNTIKIDSEGKSRGFNTDGSGFYNSLKEDLHFDPEDKKIFVAGAGGAANAIVMRLGEIPSEIYIFDIDKNRSNEMAKHYEMFFNRNKLVLVTEARDILNVIKRCDLLVNTTPVGMRPDDPSPVDRRCLRQDLYVYDIIYNQAVTRLVKEALLTGAKAVTGLGMLLRQGAAAFEIWTGRKAPVGVMKSALEEALSPAS